MRRKTFYLLFVLASLLIVLGGATLRYFLKTLPPIQMLEEYLPQLTTRIYDSQGNMITELFTQRRVWIPLNQIPVDLQNAFIAIEDDKFFKHWGVSPQGMLRASIKNFIAGRVVQGGSTITQQLSKLIFLTQERTFVRKFRELLLSLQVEFRFSKEEILQMYLNQVYFGHGAYGVAAAAKTFFGKRIDELNLAECATIAGIPKLPSYYSPTRHPKRALARRGIVLYRMKELNYISDEEEKLARDSPLETYKTSVKESVAPYFIEYLRKALEAKYGGDALYRGGLAIYTTLDRRMQAAAEKAMIPALESFDEKYGMKAEIIRADLKAEKMIEEGLAPEDFTLEPSTTITKVQGALVALDPRSGAIRAMVGGRDFRESQFNRAVQAKRQPGSTFKPFVWLAALESGMTSAHMIEDSPLAFYNDGHDWRLLEGATDAFTIMEATSAFEDDQVWVPKNYDNKYLGSITLRKAMARSRNIAAIRLIDQVNPRKVVEWAQKTGIESRLSAVLSLSLGTSLVDLLELTGAFGTTAAEGIRKEPYAITKILDFEGKILEENFPQEKEVISPALNYQITNLLKAVVTEGTARVATRLRRPVAGKTGTSQDQRDLWFVGFTPNLVAGTWMGYDDFSPLGKKIGSSGIIVPWWTEFMKEALQELPPKDFRVPEEIIFAKIDSTTGFLAIPSCPKIILEAFVSGTEPKEFCPVDHTVREPISDH